MELTRDYMTQTGMQSDTYFTGKLYPKLDALFIDKDGVVSYICSSCQFKTQRRFKQSLLERKNYDHGTLKIVKGSD